LLATPSSNISLEIEKPLSETTADESASIIANQSITEEPEESNQTNEEISSPQEQVEFAPKAPIDKFHPPIPYRQFEELRIKLKIIEAKRSEDRERWKQFEQSRAETEQFLALKNKLTAKLTEMQAELRETRSTINSITREKEDMELKSLEVSETLEMVALDKEMAEEKADNLAHELEALKERLAEVTTSLQVYQNPSASFIGSPDQSTLPQHSAELEKQNERLKDALVRLRDISTETETKLQRKIKELEREVLAIADLRHHHDKVKEQLEQSQNQVELLKERLDDALASEELVEQLTDKNLNLGEKIEEMQIVIEDLEALKELNDELEETHLEAAKQLQEEIDIKDSQIRELVRRFDTQQESVADYENTISQFRNLVSTLQNDLQHLREQQADQATHTEALSSQSQAMMNLNLHLQNSVTKAQAKAIDLELRKFDANQAIEHLTYVQPYLPSSFFKKENDSISCLLIFKRMGFKADLIGTQLVNQSLSQYQANPKSMLSILASDYLMRLELVKFSNVMKSFTIYLSTCTVPEFSKIGQYHSQLISQEKSLDHLIQVLQKEQFQSSQLISDFRPLAASFEHMAQTHLAESSRVKSLEPYLMFNIVVHGLDVFETYLKLAKQGLKLENEDEGTQLSIDEDSKEQIATNFIEPLSNLINLNSQFGVQLKKFLKKLDPINDGQKSLKPEISSLFTPIYQEYLRFIQFAVILQSKLDEYIKEKLQASESVFFNTVQNITNSCSQQELNLNEVSPFDSATRTVNHLISLLSNLNEKVSFDDPKSLPWVDLSAAEAPWVIRSREFQKEIVVDKAMERKLESLNEEIISLVKDVKTKDTSLQEALLKVDHLQHRSENYKQQAESAKEQEIQLNKAREQEQSFERTLEKLYQDIANLEEENLTLKEEKAQAQSKFINNNYLKLILT
jgi:dynactin 1